MRDKALSVALQPPPEDWQWRTSQDTTSPVENVAVEPVQCEARVDCEHVFEYAADQSSAAIWLSASFYAPSPASMPRCKHGTLDPNGRPWPQRADKAQSVVEANHIHPDHLDPDVGKCLDTTLFHADKRGWDESWQYLFG